LPLNKLTQPTIATANTVKGVKVRVQVKGVHEGARFSSLNSSEPVSSPQKLVKLLPR